LTFKAKAYDVILSIEHCGMSLFDAMNTDLIEVIKKFLQVAVAYRLMLQTVRLLQAIISLKLAQYPFPTVTRRHKIDT
jgi:hypothetical protein